MDLTKFQRLVSSAYFGQDLKNKEKKPQYQYFVNTSDLIYLCLYWLWDLMKKKKEALSEAEFVQENGSTICLPP